MRASFRSVSLMLAAFVLLSTANEPAMGQAPKPADATSASKGPWITSIAIGPAGEEAVFGSGAGLPLRPSPLLKGNTAQPKSLQTAAELPATIWKVLLVENRTKVLASEYSGGIHFGTLADPTSIKKLDTKTRWSRAMVELKDGRALIGTEDGKIVPLQLTDGAVAPPIEAHKAAVFGLTISPDALHVASSGGDGVVKLWKLPELTLVKEFAVAKVAVWDAIVSADGKWLVTADADRRVNLYSVETGKLQMTLAILPDWVTSLAALPDQVVAAGCLNGKVYFIDLPSKLVMTDWKGPGSGVWAIASCEDGKHLWVGTRSHGAAVIPIEAWGPALAATRQRSAEEHPPEPKQ